MPRDHHFTIRGRRILWRYARLRGNAAGWAYMPDSKNPHLAHKVLIDETLKPGSLACVETELHEGLHQCLPDMSEEAITEIAHDLARIMTNLYRLEPRHGKGQKPTGRG